MAPEVRVAVVTGGNRGLGLETCRQLAKRGLRVVLASRDERKGVDAADTLRREGLDVESRVLDVASEASVAAFRAFLENEVGRADVLVNNAGILAGDGGLTGVDLDSLRRTFETNVYGALFLCQAVIPLMQRRGYGRVVNVSSDLGQLSAMGAGWPAYRLSKAALNALTRVVAAEVAGTNVLVNSMSPGWVKTDMGGEAAPRTVDEGADTIVWLATLPDGGPSGGFFRDRRPIEW